MALYKYLKQEPKKSKLVRARPKKELSFIFSVLGLILVGNAVIPILSYQLRYASKFGKILSPLVAERKEILGVTTASAKGDEQDYTLISSWFNEVPNLDTNRHLPVTSYAISIPKLGIERARVLFEAEDLKKTLIHYSETSFPGQFGNAVIFGHSVLPQFFNPENYLTIFSTLYRLKEGDQVLVSFDGITYQYRVEELFEVSAGDLTVLEQRYDDRFLTLITCSPPGTYLRRLVVRTRLVEQRDDFVRN